MPRYLNQALAAGAEAHTLVAAALARLARDQAAAASCAADAGAAGGPQRGRALPLLALAATAPGAVRVGGRLAVELVSEGSGPLVLAAGGAAACASAAGSDVGIVVVQGTAGLLAWLSLCKPAALWSAATAQRSPGAAEASPNVSLHVAAALQAALAASLTEQMVSEVWAALAEQEVAGRLQRRAGGTWTQLVQDGIFVL